MQCRIRIFEVDAINAIEYEVVALLDRHSVVSHPREGLKISGRERELGFEHQVSIHTRDAEFRRIGQGVAPGLRKNKSLKEKAQQSC